MPVVLPVVLGEDIPLGEDVPIEPVELPAELPDAPPAAPPAAKAQLLATTMAVANMTVVIFILLSPCSLTRDKKRKSFLQRRSRCARAALRYVLNRGTSAAKIMALQTRWHRGAFSTDSFPSPYYRSSELSQELMLSGQVFRTFLNKERSAMTEKNNLQELFHETLKDIYFAEKKILSALPKMAKAAQS
jgi:hypothetical protein